MHLTATKKAILAGSAVVALAAAGCGASFSAEDLEEDVVKVLEEEFGERPDSVTCEGGLEGEEGEIQRCESVVGEESFAWTVTVTKVDGNNIEYIVTPEAAEGSEDAPDE